MGVLMALSRADPFGITGNKVGEERVRGLIEKHLMLLTVKNRKKENCQNEGCYIIL